MACAPFSTDENCFRKTYKSSHETLGSTNCKTRIFAFRIFLMVWGNDAFDSVEMCNKFASSLMLWFHYYDINIRSFCVYVCILVWNIFFSNQNQIKPAVNNAIWQGCNQIVLKNFVNSHTFSYVKIALFFGTYQLILAIH